MKRYVLYGLIFLINISFLFSVRTIPYIEFWDEHWWIARGYFFELLIQRNFSDSLWQGYYSYDQPKLAEYVHGAWQYPLYLNKRKELGTKYRYTDFLKEGNFYSIDTFPPKTTESFIAWNATDGLTIDQAIQRYGEPFTKTIRMVLHGRSLSILFVAASGLLVFVITKYILSSIAAFMLMAAFLSNTVTVYGGIKATSEGMFLFFYLAGLLIMIRMFCARTLRFDTAAILGIITALCSLTKLNGISLTIPYFIMLIWHTVYTRERARNATLHVLVYIGVFLVFFIAASPFLYTNPVKGAIFMYKWRYSVAQKNQIEFPQSALWSITDRSNRIFQRYYTEVQLNLGLPFVFHLNRYIPYEKRYIFHFVRVLNYCRLVLALIGLFYLMRLSMRKAPRSIYSGGLPASLVILLFSGTSIMMLMTYLMIDWMPYFITLTFPILLFETIGFVQIWRSITNLLITK